MASPPCVGVIPAAVLRSHGRLLAALEVAADVRFVSGEGGHSGGIDAMMVFPGADLDGQPIPQRLPCHVMAVPENRATSDVAVFLTHDPHLPDSLRGQLLREDHAPFLGEILAGEAGGPLAVAGGVRVWERGQDRLRTNALMAPEELAPGEPLRGRLRTGRFLALLPLLLFLRSLQHGGQWRPPPLRASLVFDDPNLRALNYGFLDFRELAAWTRSRGSHVTFAMVPLDGRFVAKRAVDLFRREPGLSLMVHGNNHLKCELDRNWTEDERLAMLEQALARIASFERRTGVEVSRVMVPPHGVWAEASAEAMRLLGYEALCANQPYPWLQGPPPDRPLVGWGISEIVSGGLPVLPRLPMGDERSELVFRALLGQPLIVYGHHTDVRDGLGILAEYADAIERMGAVRWCSLAEIARSNYSTRVIPDGIELRPYSRLAEVAMPDGCSALRVSPPEDGLDLLDHPVRWRRLRDESSGWTALSAGEAISTRPGDRLQIAFGTPPIRRNLRPAHSLTLRAIARRAATEARDRLQPLGRRPHTVYR